MTVEPLLYTVGQASAAMAISSRETYRLIAAGALKAIHVGRARRVPVEECKAFIARQLAQGEPS